MGAWIRRLGLGLALGAAASAAAAAASGGDPKAGKALYAACTPCHGTQGEGVPALSGPSLAGQSSTYLARQLESFRAGLRGAAAQDAEGARMRTAAAGLGDAQIRDLVAYLETLPAPETTVSVAGDLRNGANYYQMKCNACHGLRAEGNPLLEAPRLAGTSDAYLLRQLEAFQTGLRGSSASDRFGRQMALMARTLPDDKTRRDVVAYVRSLADGSGSKTPAQGRRP